MFSLKKFLTKNNGENIRKQNFERSLHCDLDNFLLNLAIYSK